MNVRRIVESEDGARHELVTRLGVGGQGEVWLTANRRRVVKLCTGATRPESVRRQFAHVRRLPLGGLHVARPLSLLRAPALGYVADFLDEMVSARTLLAPAKGESPEAWWLATGGLRRRLRLLAHVAEVVAGLHELGLVYGDLSASNVFISADRARAEAWLIDLDNVRHDVEQPHFIHTPDFGAPEVVAGTRGISSLSDAWSFAVLASWALTLVHPLKGDLVDDGEVELEEDALAGRLPWIGDPTDASNASSNGVPLTHVLSANLRRLANDAFGPGRLDRLARPSVATWIAALHAAADRTITCERCTQTYFDRAATCPWCDEPRPAHGRLEFFRADVGGVIESAGLRAVVTFDRAGTTTVTRRLTDLPPDLQSREPVITLTPARGAVVVKPTGEAAVWLSESPTATTYRALPSQGVPLAYGQQWIHFGPPDQPHRVAILKGGAS